MYQAFTEHTVGQTANYITFHMNTTLAKYPVISLCASYTWPILWSDSTV